MKVTISRAKLNSIVETVVSKVLKEATKPNSLDFYALFTYNLSTPPVEIKKSNSIDKKVIESEEFTSFIEELDGYGVEEIDYPLSSIYVPGKIGKRIIKNIDTYKRNSKGEWVTDIVIGKFNGKPVRAILYIDNPGDYV